MGSLYLLVAYEAGVDGTLFSMLVRTELALPFVSRVYNVLITAHAFLMIFFLIMPALLGGFTNLLVPIQIGSAEMALPRLNAISFMLLPPSLLLLLSCVHVEVGAGVGWTVYPPLSRRIGIGVDVAIVSLHLSGLSSLAGSINVLTTILLMRGPALAMQRVPLFVWGVLITNLLLLLSIQLGSPNHRFSASPRPPTMRGRRNGHDRHTIGTLWRSHRGDARTKPATPPPAL